MTFFQPDFDGVRRVWAAPFPAFEWFASLSPQTAAKAMVDIQAASFDATVRLMLVPFDVLSGAHAPATAFQHDEAVAESPAASTPAAAAVESPAIAVPLAPVSAERVEGVAPALFNAPQGTPDDLLLIRGIGPKLGQLLNSLGVWHYNQIVSWTPAEVAWINEKIDFNGRIQREAWQAQAAELASSRKAA